ncbi:MAG TPA: hypothetical protein VIM58_07685 [Candidatus Methylacidiphilales bacterium]
MTSFLLYAGDHLWLHWALGLGCLAGAVWAAWGPFPGSGEGGGKRTLAFAFFVLLTLGAFKYPGFLYPTWVNPDEAVFLAEAHTYRDLPHALPWRDIDGYSGGPLIPLQLLWTVPFGIPLDYAAGRVTSTVDEALFLLFLWLALRRVFGLRIAGATVLPFLLLFALDSQTELAFYASEDPAFPLFGAALLFLAMLLQEGKGGPAFGLGCVLGAVPFVKLQGGPLIVFLGGTGLVLAWRRGGGKGAAALLAGACVPALLLLGPVAAAGEFRTFWNEYVAWAFGYVGGEKSWLKRFQLGFEFLFDTRFPQGFLIAQTAAFFLAFLLPGRKAWTGRQWAWVLWLTAFFGVSLTVAMVSGKNYFHYAFFFYPALALCWAAAMKGMEGRNFAALGRAGRIGLALAGVFAVLWAVSLGMLKAKGAVPVFDAWIGASFAVLVLALLAAGAAFPRVPFSDPRRVFVVAFLLPLLAFSHYHGRYAGHLARNAALPSAPLVPAAKALARPGDRMAVWGWSPEIAFEAGLPLGTRDPATDMAILESPVRDAYRARFLRDLRANRPRFFVEAIGEGSPWYPDRETQGIGAFPELAGYVSEHYRLASEERGLRLYILKEE